VNGNAKENMFRYSSSFQGMASGILKNSQLIQKMQKNNYNKNFPPKVFDEKNGFNNNKVLKIFWLRYQNNFLIIEPKIPKKSSTTYL